MILQQNFIFLIPRIEIFIVCLKENIVGGPGIIFNRYQESGKTFIRNKPNKPCQKIIGYDANALYLWAIGQDFPVGYPLIRHQQKFFVCEFPHFSGG